MPALPPDGRLAGGVRFLLDAQNPNGSWGTYTRQEQRLGKYVDHWLRLHTTMVAIGALTAVFERPMLRADR